MNSKHRMIALLCAIAMMLPMVGCGKDTVVPNNSDNTTTDTNIEETISGSDIQENKKDEMPLTSEDIQKKMLENTLELREINNDTIGWLYIPNTEINDGVVKVNYDDQNNYYLRRNEKGEDDYYGCYYADWRCVAGDRSKLSKNTIIYGHSMGEDPNGVKFSQLKKFLHKDFAEATPYIYFSTKEGDMIWEIFAVYYTSTDFDYIDVDPLAAFYQQLLDISKGLSFYDYNVNVTTSDKILTLSTCTYKLADGTKLSYPNDYRLVVMAKLIPEGTALKDSVSLTVTSKAPKTVNEPYFK